jgi:hypothetical protein
VHCLYAGAAAPARHRAGAYGDAAALDDAIATLGDAIAALGDAIAE